MNDHEYKTQYNERDCIVEFTYVPAMPSKTKFEWYTSFVTINKVRVGQSVSDEDMKRLEDECMALIE